MCFGPRSHSSIPSTEQNADWVHLAQCICCFHSRNLLKPVRPQWDFNEGRFGAGWALKLKIWKAYFKWLMRSKFPHLPVLIGIYHTIFYIWCFHFFCSHFDAMALDGRLSSWNKNSSMNHERRRGKRALSDHLLSLYFPYTYTYFHILQSSDSVTL